LQSGQFEERYDEVGGAVKRERYDEVGGAVKRGQWFCTALAVGKKKKFCCIWQSYYFQWRTHFPSLAIDWHTVSLALSL
jgi:hypothetical protein